MLRLRRPGIEPLGSRASDRGLLMDHVERLRRQAAVWLRAVAGGCAVALALLLAPTPSPAQQCVEGACVSAGPRLVSVDTTQSALLNPLFQALLPGTSVQLSVLDWNALAGADINLNALLTQLQTDLNLSSTSEVLGANITLAQLQAAMISVLQADGSTAAANALGLLPLDFPGLAGTIQLADLLQISLPQGSLADIDLDLLDLVTGAVQLYNYENVLTTPQPVTVDTGAIGLAGVTNVVMWVQVVEPPVYVCGGVGTEFHTAAIRIKLNADVLGGFDLQPILDAIGALSLGITNVTLTQDVLKLQLYADVARAEGSIAGIDAVNQVVTLNARPGIASLYLGTITDTVFFNRTQVITPAVVTPVQLTTMDLGFNINVALVGNVRVQVPLTVTGRAVATGTPELMNAAIPGPYPATHTFASGTVSVGTLVTSLLNSLDLQVTGGDPVATLLGVPIPLPVVVGPIINTLVDTVEATLQLTANSVLAPAFQTLLGGLVDPLLQLLGIQIGQAVFTVEGLGQACSAALVLAKVLDPVDDPGLFNLSVGQGGNVLASASDVGHNGATSPVVTTPGLQYDLAETAGTGTALGAYQTTWACTDQDGTAVSSGSGTAFSLTAPALAPEPVTITCRITNRTLRANLSVTKTDGSATYTPGEGATYTVTVSNAGPDPVVGATVTDTLPNGATLAGPWTCSATNGACTPVSGGAVGGQTVSLTVDLEAGGQAVISIPVNFSANPGDY